jgi:NAD-dependent deacetylase
MGSLPGQAERIMTTGTEKIARLIGQSSAITVFTGAGISTESGIPDFRSPGGIWSRMQPVTFQDFVASEDMRREAWRRKIAIDRAAPNPLPNRGHRAVAELVSRGMCRSVITQNIDGLHQASGIDRDVIIELHGNGTYARCLDCSRDYELAPIIEAFELRDELPTCAVCGGMVKSAVIAFGQPMPEVAMMRAKQAAMNCDLFIATGSSLVVYPAAGFPLMARQNGAKLVILNREATELDAYADLVVHGEIGPVLGDAVGVD